MNMPDTLKKAWNKIFHDFQLIHQFFHTAINEGQNHNKQQSKKAFASQCYQIILRCKSKEKDKFPIKLTTVSFIFFGQIIYSHKK